MKNKGKVKGNVPLHIFSNQLTHTNLKTYKYKFRKTDTSTK